MWTAVIGHGRSPEGKGWGKEIDGCDRVIRMFDWHWQKEADYGTRYDYGLFTINDGQLQIFWSRNREHPGRGWLGYPIKENWKGRLPNRTEVLNPAPWVESMRALGGSSLGDKLTLTRGGAAVAWVLQQAQIGDVLVLVGFDNLRAGKNLPWAEAFSPEYSAVYYGHAGRNRGKPYAEGSSKTVTHDLIAEQRLLVKMAVQAGVLIAHAEDVWNNVSPFTNLGTT